MKGLQLPLLIASQWQVKKRCGMQDNLEKEKYVIKYQGSFKNHVEIVLLFFNHPPTSVDTFYVLNVDKNGKFQTTYPPLLVHMVIECPLINFHTNSWIWDYLWLKIKVHVFFYPKVRIYVQAKEVPSLILSGVTQKDDSTMTKSWVIAD